MRDFIAFVRQQPSAGGMSCGPVDEVVEELASELEARYTALCSGARATKRHGGMWSGKSVVAALAHDVVAAGSVLRATGLTRLPGSSRSNAGRARSASAYGCSERTRFHGHRDRHARRLPWRARRDRGSGRRHAAPPIAGAGTGSRAPHGEPISARRGRRGRLSSTPGLRRQAPARHGVRGTGVLQLSAGTIETGGAPTRTPGMVTTLSSSVSCASIRHKGVTSRRPKARSATTPGSSSPTDSGASSLAPTDGHRPDSSSRDATTRSWGFCRATFRWSTPPRASGFRWRYRQQRSDDARHRNGWFSIGRLKPGATIEQARISSKPWTRPTSRQARRPRPWL